MLQGSISVGGFITQDSNGIAMLQGISFFFSFHAQGQDPRLGKYCGVIFYHFIMKTLWPY